MCVEVLRLNKIFFARISFSRKCTELYGRVGHRNVRPVLFSLHRIPTTWIATTWMETEGVLILGEYKSIEQSYGADWILQIQINSNSHWFIVFKLQFKSLAIPYNIWIVSFHLVLFMLNREELWQCTGIPFQAKVEWFF